MRDFKGMKRQRGRNRGSSGGNQGGKPQHNANRAFDSNGPEGIKVRGAAQGVFEKYQQLSRDAGSAGDRVLAENYLQHAEHYFRTLRAMQPHRPVSDIVGREQFASGFDIDFEAEPEDPPEGGYVEQTETPAEGEGQQQQQRDGHRDNQGGQRFEGRQRDGQRFEGRDRQRDDRPRDERPRDERPRDDRPQRDDRPRDERPRDDRPREERPRQEGEGASRRDRWRDRDDRQPRGDRGDAPRDPLAVIEPQAAAPLAPESAVSESPRLRGQDGAVSELPAFLGRPAEPREEAPAEEAKKPRRRRAPRSFEGGEGAKPETEEA